MSAMNYYGQHVGTSNAILSLLPGAQFSITNNEYDLIEWRDEREIPTQEAVEAELRRLDELWVANQYQRDRMPEYPSLGDQLDDLFHAGAFSDEMAAKIQAVKDRFPKASS